jgi:hypothetical protein
MSALAVAQSRVTVSNPSRGTNMIYASVISAFRRNVKEICILLGFARCRVVIPYRRFGTTYESHLQGSEQLWSALPLKMGPVCCPEKSVGNYHSALRKIPKESRYNELGIFTFCM